MMRVIFLVLFLLLSRPATADSFSNSLGNAVSGGFSGYLRLNADDTVAVDAAPHVDVTQPPYSAKGDDSTDNCTTIQAAIDGNQTSVIYFPAGTYRSSCAIILTNASGKAFSGGIRCNNATIKFTNAGSAANTDAVMQNGFTSYAKVNGVGGDVTGWGNSSLARIDGCTIDGPLHGAGVRLGNSIGATFTRNTFQNNRYGVAAESTINARFFENRFVIGKNAGVGFIYSGNTSIYPGAAMFNDSYTFMNNTCAGDVAGSIAFILDTGSLSERNRLIIGNSCQGANGGTGVQYGYLGRGVDPTMISNWYENIKYPVRILSTNAGEGGSGTAITGITAREPGGTMTVGDMPDTYCTGIKAFGNYAAQATIAWQPDCSGAMLWGGNFTNGTTTDIKLTQGGKYFVYLGDTRSDTTPPVISNLYSGFMNIVGSIPSISSGFGTSPTLNFAPNSAAFKVTVGTGGTANSGVIAFDKAAGNGYACDATNSSNVSVIRSEVTSTSAVTLKNYNASLTPTAWTAGDLLVIKCREF